jgi:3-phenylpropionate/trans-cinnamate dioxygenase ferredoxin subunit
MGQIAKISSKNLPSGKGMCTEIEGKRIAVFNVNGKYYAMDEECPHAGGPLSEGDIDGNEVICPWHGAGFNLETGEVTNGPAKTGVRTYAVHVEGDEIKIDVGS